MKDVLTTRDSFPVEDITHRPKRYQRDNLKSAQTVSELSESEDAPSAPSVVTLERAIRFYEDNAKGELRQLYLQTAKWLTSILVKSTSTQE